MNEQYPICYGEQFCEIVMTAGTFVWVFVVVLLVAILWGWFR